MSAPKRTAKSLATSLLGLLGFSVIAGILITVAVTPAVAVTGVAANNTISLFENLPSYLEVGSLPQRSTIYATNTDGSQVELATFYNQNREEVGWDAIPQFVKDAAIAGEDPRFFEHNGVDLQGTIRGFISTTSGGSVQGGSSITQQYVKNVLINNGVSEAKTDEERKAAYDAATKVSFDRKLKEMRYAIALEKKTSKQNILLGYLNIALFGGRVYGIQSAAQYYYGKNAADLTLPEAASLIAIVNNPEKFRLDKPDSEGNGAHTQVNGQEVPYAQNKERRDYIIDQMLKYQKITQEQHDEAINTPVAPSIHQPSTGCETAAGAAYFCDYVTQVIKHSYDDPKTSDVNEGARLLQEGGLIIHTTLDTELQAKAEAAMTDWVPATDPRFNIGSVAVSVQPGTGKVLAMVQNKKYSQDQEVLNSSPDYTAINYATDYDYGGSSGFQPGSTFKIFTLAEWLNEGHSLRETFNGSRRPFVNFPDSCNGNQRMSPAWNPRNDDGNSANNAVNATKYSVNTAFVAMAQELDLCKIKQTAEAFGVKRADGLELGQKFETNDDGSVKEDANGKRIVNPNEFFHPSAVLGTEEVSPLSMANAFAAVAANGLVCDPVVIEGITKIDGTAVDPPNPNCRQAVDPNVAHGMAYAMQTVFSGTASSSNTGSGVPHIGKTGTTDDAIATWMDGASTKVATAVWVGNVSGFQNLRNISVGGTQAALIRHRIWKSIMTFADDKYGGDSFPQPDNSAFKTIKIDIPNLSGMTFDQAKTALENAGFSVENGGTTPSELPAGQVVSTDPTSQASKYTTITVYTSDGQQVTIPDLTGLTAEQAKAALDPLGLTLTVTGNTGGNGNAQGGVDRAKVGAQSPAPTSIAVKGSAVTVTMQ